MPVLIIYGIPQEMAGHLNEFRDLLIDTVVNSVKELQLETKDVSCYFPQDLMFKGLGKEIIIFVDGLIDKPERTKEVRDKLAKSIVQTTNHFFDDLKLIECFIRPFYSEQGFSSLSM